MSIGFTSRVGHRRLYLPCDCAYDKDYIHLEFFLDDFGNDDIPMLFISLQNAPSSFWDRIKAAWAVLRGRDHYFSEIILEREAVRQLHEFVGEFLSKYPAIKQPE